MDNSATVGGGLPPLPPGATLNSAPANSGSSLPPLPPGATLQPAGSPPPATNPPAAAPSSGLGQWASRMFEGQGEEGPGSWGDSAPGELLAGAVKSAGSALGGILDMVTSPKADAGFKVAYKAQHPQSTDQEADQAFAEQYAQTQGGRINKHLQDAAHWLRSGSEPHDFWEHVGAIGEQVLEYVGTDGLLKMAGNGARVAEAGSRGAQAAEQLKQAQQVAATLKANPKLAGLVSIGLKASKDAAMMGAQTYVHTEDPTQSAIAAAGGGVLSGTTGLAARYLQKIAPKNLSIAGEEMPALASQVNEAGEPMDVPTQGAPAIARAQQQGAAGVIRNTAQQATAQAIDRINQTRPAVSAIQDTTRMLSAGERATSQAPSYAYSPSGKMSMGAPPAESGSGTFTFTLEGQAAPSESAEGELTSPAKEIPRTHTSLPAERTAEDVEAARVGTEPEYIQPAGPGGAISERTGRSWVERRTPGYMHAGPEVEGAADVTNNANLNTTDPRQATGWLRQLEDLQRTPEFADLPEAQQKLVRERAQALNEQLSMYYRSPYVERFAPTNIWHAIDGVHTFGDAADQIEGSAQQVYSTLDRLSEGKFNALKEIAKRQASLMASPASEEAYQNAQTRYREAQKGIDDLINSHRGQVSTADYMTAKHAWSSASRLNELHSVFESMMNGVTQEQSERGMTRVMTGNAKRLEAYLSEGTNREQLQRMIGTEGLDNLTRITLLLKSANTARTVQDVAGRVAMEMERHLGPHVAGGGVMAFGGALAGGGLAHMLGIPEYYGAIGGALGTRAVLRMAATSPAVGHMVDYAVRNGISPQVYAPLIARTIAEPFQSQKEAEPQEPAADAQQ